MLFSLFSLNSLYSLLLGIVFDTRGYRGGKLSPRSSLRGALALIKSHSRLSYRQNSSIQQPSDTPIRNLLAHRFRNEEIDLSHS